MTQQLSPAATSTLRHWQLTVSLRGFREEAGMTIEQAVAELGKGTGRWSRAKLSRIENRGQGVKAAEVEQLLDVYAVSGSRRAAVLELAGTTQDRGWWLTLRRDLPEDFHPILSLESALVAKRQFETMLVPGLLQTPDYARAVIAGLAPDAPADRTERKVVARMLRQQVLTGDHPLRLHVVLEQAVLERRVGEPAVLRRQLRRLLEAAQAPHVTLQVIGKDAGPHPGWEGQFSILSLPEPIPDIGYVEGNGGAVYVDNQERVRRSTRRFEILAERAMPQSRSLDLIEATARALG